MPVPTNPKKRALMPSTKLRKTLRAAGHHLSAVVQVGKEGITDAVVRQLDEALAAHELVKVKIGTETPEDRFEAADRLGEATDGLIAQILGRTILVYRRHPEKPRFEAAPAPPANAKAKTKTNAKAKSKAKAKAKSKSKVKPAARARR
jgi:RNA-binding protein